MNGKQKASSSEDDDQQDSSPPPPPPPRTRRPGTTATATASASSSKINLVDSHSYKPTLLPGRTEATIVGFDYPDDVDGAASSAGLAPPRPRRLWRVSDTSLRPIPPFYPPLNPRCCRILSAGGSGGSGGTPPSPPSVLAVRIAECLRTLGVAAEYDEESATATALTVDRCHFSIHLWKHTQGGGGGGGDAAAASANAIVVECVRLRGSVFTFHRTVRSVLDAASGLDGGRLRTAPAAARELHRTSASPLDYARLAAQKQPPLQHQQQQQSATGSSPSSRSSRPSSLLALPTRRAGAVAGAATAALEHAANLLRKDRVECQQLGMECLVGLTDRYASGTDVALYASLAVLGAPLQASASTGGGPAGAAPATAVHREQALLKEIHTKWILGLLVDRILPGEPSLEGPPTPAPADTSFSFSSCATSLLGAADNDSAARLEMLQQAAEQQQQQHEQFYGGDEHFAGTMRSMALRATVNALTVLDVMQPKILVSVLAVQSPQLSSPSLIQALLDDVKGASRPPAVVAGTRLASPHEAVYALVILRLLGKHSKKARRLIVTEESLELLEKARFVGLATNQVLAEEAKESYLVLTEDVRSC